MSTPSTSSTAATVEHALDACAYSPLAELGRRRRDVTLVLLPGPPRLLGAPRPTEHEWRADAARLAQRARVVRAEVETLWGRPADVVHELWWQVAPGVEAFVLTIALRGLEPGHDPAIEHLRTLGRHLLGSGWTARGSDGPPASLLARREPLRLRARALEASLELEIGTEPLRALR